MTRRAIGVSEEALFRHQVVSEVGSRVLSGMPVTEAIAEVLELRHQDLTGKERRLTERTIYRWLKAFKEGGVSGLEPAERSRITSSNALSEEMLRFLKAQKLLDPEASIPEIIRHAEANGAVERGKVDRTSVWRACKRLGLPIDRPRRRTERDMRRFAYPHRMMMVLADGKHFRAGANRVKRVALTLLDDATRRGLGVVVATTESTEVFLEALHQTIQQEGLTISLFLDNGPGFISAITRRVVAQLGIQLILGTPAYPEGHGKIERFNRRFKDQVIRHLDGNPAVDPDPASLTLRLNHWLTEIYNRDPHYGLGGDSPLQRWDADERELILPPEGWQQHFIITFGRKVSNDNVISYNGVAYEVPRGSAGRSITVSRHLLDDNALTVIDQGKSVKLHPVDLVANAHARRARRPSAADRFSSSPKPQQSAASARFDADMEPMVESDGGYQKGQDDE
jgi:putative transposase